METGTRLVASSFVALAVLAATPAVAAAPPPGARLLVFPFEGVDLPEATRIGAAQAFAMYLTEQGYQVYPVPSDVRPGTSLDIARETARQSGADVYVLGYVTRLGETSIVQVRGYALVGDAPVYADHITVGRAEDMAPALRRMARALATGGKAATTRDIYTVTEKEERALRREEVAKYFGVRLGGVSFVAGGPDELLTGAGVYGLYDARFALFDLSFSVFGGGGSSHVSLDLGAYYPLTDTALTPYLGGGLSLSALEPEFGYGAGGLGVFAAAGVILARTSSVNVRADVRYLLNTYETGEARELGQGILFAAGLNF